MKVHSMIFTTMKHYQTSSCSRNILKGYRLKRHVKMASKTIETSAEASQGMCSPAYDRQRKTWQAASALFSSKTFEPKASYTHSQLTAAAPVPVLLTDPRVIRCTGLAVGAKARDTVRLSANGALSGKLKTRVNDSLVDAGGARLTLEEGQTVARFELVNEGEIEEVLTGSISASYNGEESADSHSWDVTVPDAGTRMRSCARNARRVSKHYIFSSCFRNILLVCRPKTQPLNSAVPVSQIAQKPALALILEQE